jgi:Xanthine and CO dehydrogenases maturation factor, XdhC/CoxF family
MKHWQETSRILQKLAQLAEQGRGAALATVVNIRGSAYRRPGAKMLIEDDGTMAGSVSGGCLEADVREVALSVIRDGIPQLVHYDTGLDDETPFGLGLGCNGAVDIFVQRATERDLLETSRRIALLLEGEATFAVSTVVSGATGLGRSVVVGMNGKPVGSTGDANLDRMIMARARELLGTGTSQINDLDRHRVFTEIQLPPPSLLVIGAGEDTRPLVASASDVGFRVTVVDHRSAYLSPSHYPSGMRLVKARSDSNLFDLPLGPRAYAVVKTHSMEHDREWVRRLLASDVQYIGVLGSRARIDDLLRELGAEENERVFGPVGLDLGADGPEQIAVSVVAELLAFLSGREPGHLRSREGAIHAG